MEKSNPLKVYGVLGFPVKHSFSPAMHNAAFRELNIEAEYLKFEKNPGELDKFLRTLHANNICGINVTIPYKEKVLPYLGWCSPEVKFTGACNTIVVKGDGALEGWNTDGLGFHKHLFDLGYELAGKKVIILGAGGAAKAVVNQLVRHKAAAVTIYDVDTIKSGQLADKANSDPENRGAKVSVASSIDSLDLANTDLLINATPIGMKPADPCLIDGNKLHDRLFVYDLIYNPAETELLKRAKGQGAGVANGLGMLLWQGVLAFKHFTGKEAPVEVMKAALGEEIKKL